MNALRVADLLEELAVALREGTATPGESGGEAADSTDSSRPPRLRIPIRPPGESDELARAAARRALREHGLLEILKR
jgi:hypothetical protein